MGQNSSDSQNQPNSIGFGTADTQTYYYVLNLQGDVVELVEYEHNGLMYTMTTVASYTYNAWGEILSAIGTMASVNPLRYRGYYYDSETGFYYLQSRYYDPTMHRFINADSLASTGTGVLGYNMFAYCENNPISYVDSKGTKIELVGQGSIKGMLLKIILSLLSDDSLSFEDGHVSISKRNESPTHNWSTNLIRDLIESEETVYISLEYDTEYGSITTKGENGIFIVLDMTQHSENNPAHIVLAHELIHALRHVQGEHNNIDMIEEAETIGYNCWIGLTYYSSQYDGPTENKIRTEFGLRQRVAY